MEEIENPRDLEELRALFEEENLINLNKHMTDYLMKIGVKLRRYKWKECEAS